MALTRKQQRFVAEYLLDLNATQAAIRAGYSGKTSSSTGWENLRKPEIAAAIQEAMDARAERNGISQDAVVEELKRIGTSDLRDYATWGPAGVEWFASEEVEPEAARALSEASMTKEVRYTQTGDKVETTNTKLKLHDKKGALELLGRHLGMFKDNLNIQTDEPVVIKVKGLSKQAEG